MEIRLTHPVSLSITNCYFKDVDVYLDAPILLLDVCTFIRCNIYIKIQHLHIYGSTLIDNEFFVDDDGTNEQLIKYKLKKEKSVKLAPPISLNEYLYGKASLACNVPAAVPAAQGAPAVKKEKGNKPMCYDCDDCYDDDCCSTDTVTEKKVNYLKGRAYRIRDDKQTELRKQFSMDADLPPATPEELVERIKNDRFTLVEKDKRTWYHNAQTSIIWKDPKVPADPVGYEAAMKELDKEYTKVIDAIMVLEAKEALETVTEFEAA